MHGHGHESLRSLTSQINTFIISFVDWRGGDSSHMSVTSSIPQRSPTSGALQLLRLLATSSHDVAGFGARAWGLSAKILDRGRQWCRLGITSLIAGILVSLFFLCEFD